MGETDRNAFFSETTFFTHSPFGQALCSEMRVSAPSRRHALPALKALPICNGRRTCGQPHPVLCWGRQPRFLERVLRKCLWLLLMENFAATSLLCLKRLPRFSCVCVLFKVLAHIFISESLRSYTQKSNRSECLLLDRCFLALQTCILCILSHQLILHVPRRLSTWLLYPCFWAKLQVRGFGCLFFFLSAFKKIYICIKLFM